MNERMIEIIRLLLERDCTVQELSNHFQVSQRTIRNDLHTINDWLKSNGLDYLDLQRGGVIVKEESFGLAQDYLEEMNMNSYHLSKEERKGIVSALLINSQGYITLSNIAEHLMVSRVTVINDLPDIKEYISKGNLKVISQPNRGLRVEGKESDKRIFLMKLLKSKDKKELLSKYISVQAGDRFILRKIVMEQEQVHNNYLTDYSFDQLVLYLGIMVERNMQGEFIEVMSHTDSNKYHMAQDILKYVTQYCQINSTRDEVQFLNNLLDSMRYSRQETDTNGVKIQMITRRFIDAIGEDLDLNLNNDYEFFENLSNHLESAYHSDASAFPESKIINEVLEDNEKIVYAVKKELPMISKILGRELKDIEVGYIVVHVCAAIERKKNKEIAFHVIVACHAGIGTSRLLLEKLKQHFNFQIVDIISSHEASRLKKDQADLVVSTVALENCPIDTIVVSPLLGDEDYIRVGNKIDVLRNTRNLPTRIETTTLTAKGLMEKLNPIIYEEAPDVAVDLSRQIRKAVRDYFHSSMDEEEDIFSPYLHHLLPPSHIQLEVECKDWKEAIQKSAQPLLDKGFIEQRYIDAMIANVEENGPYVVISKGFAIPHEGLDMGQIKVGMNLIRIKHPVDFDAEELDPVSYVCCLSAVDHKTHLKAFFNLVNLLKDPKFKERLDQCTTPDQVEQVIEKFEHSLD